VRDGFCMTPPTDNNLTEARRWLRQAEEHLAVARWNGEGKYWAAGCFQAQQAAELALKAVLIRAGERVILMHGVVALLKHVAAAHSTFGTLGGAARRLDRYYIGTRYPNGLASGTAAENFDEEDFQTAVAAATEVLSAARQVVEQA